jgi:tetratricopeptide (TPR) repeat protein
MASAPWRRLVWGVWAALACWWSLPAQAQDLEKLLQRSQRAEAERVAEHRELRSPEVSLTQLEVQWGLRRGADNAEAAERLFGQYQEAALRLGVPNHPLRASALLSEAEELWLQGRVEEARQRLAQARQVAPSLPSVAFARAGLLWEESPLSALQVAGQVWEGYRLSWGFLPSRAQWMAQAPVVLAVALSIFGVALALLALGRHLGLLLADLERALPGGVTRAQLAVGAVFAIIAPGILLGSVLISALVALALMGAYMSWSERLGGLLLCGALAALPLAAQLGGAGVNYPGSEVSRLAAWGVEGCLDDCQRALASPAPEGADPRLVQARQLLDAEWRLRRGDRAQWAEAGARYEALLKDPTLPEPFRVAALNNYGVAQATLGDLTKARESFEAVIARAPARWGYRLNRARALELGDDAAGSQQALQEAIALGGEDAAAASQRADRVVSYYFYIDYLPMEPLFDAHLEEATRASAPTLSFWRRVGGSLPLETTPSLGGGLAAALVVLLLVGRAAGASRRCPSCGEAMHAGGEGPQGEVWGVCRSCHRCFHERSAQVDYQTRVLQETRVERFAARRRWALRVLNALTPGLGTAYQGGAVGLWLFGAAALGGALVWVHQWPVRDPWRLTRLWVDGQRGLGGLLLVGALLVSALLIYLGGRAQEER